MKPPSFKERVWVYADQMERMGQILQTGRPKHKKQGHLKHISQKLGVSERTVSLALKERREARERPPEPPPSQEAVLPEGPRTPAHVIADLQKALDKFIDDVIEQRPGSINPKLVMWVEKGIETLLETWDP